MDVRLSRDDAIFRQSSFQQPDTKRGVRSVFIHALGGAFSAAILIFMVTCSGMIYFTHQLQQSGAWAVPVRPANIRVLASDGKLISDRGQMGGQSVSLSTLPPYVVQALIAIEDKRFMSHFGVDPVGLVAAAIDNLSAGRVERGGSTLTQQLAKNLFLSPEQTFARKAEEALLALWLERTYSKSQILEMYLNRVYFGAGVYGIEAAARHYFRKPAEQLTLGQAAILVGLLKAPSRLNPIANPEGAQQRAMLVLNEMARSGFISQSEIDPGPALASANSFEDSPSGSFIADWVEGLIETYVGELRSDVIVRTTIDGHLQRLAEDAIHNAVTNSGSSRHFSEGALVAMTPEGKVLALVGGVDYLSSQFNRAITARRQPGSAFKAFVYLAALEKGYTPNTVADDAQFDFEGWSPRNANRRYQGPITLLEAFAHSINTVAARLAIDVTPSVVAETAMRLGISSPIEAVPSIALGTSEVSLLELTAAYAPFANGGMGVIANVIESIETTDGIVLYKNSGIGPGEVIVPHIAATMSSMLQHSWQSTSGRPATISGLPVAGKTGTSQRGRDALFVGYTPRLVTGVWLGNDDDGATDLSGANVPLDTWYSFMTGAHSR